MTNSDQNRSHVSGVLCLLVTGCILIAGLWPFGSPPNDVTWLANSHGLRYGSRATVLSAGSLPDLPRAPCTVELWIRPAGYGSGALLAFYDPQGIAGLSLHQSITDLRLDRSGAKPSEVYASDILHRGRLAFLTVASGQDGTSVYQDGLRVLHATGFQAPPHTCSGQFVVGDLPSESNSWRGELRALAIYRRAFTDEQARSNYRSWLSNGRPSEALVGAPEVLYRFEEKGGPRVRDRGTAGVDLTIPARYTVVRKILLERPWDAFRPDWGYLTDVAINIAGFVPFGISLNMFLADRARVRRQALLVVLAGLLISLAIETLQSRLPTRDSNLTDVLSNTLGTWLGVGLDSWARRAFLTLTTSSS